MRALEQAPVRKLLTRFANKAQRSEGSSCVLKLDSKSFPEVFLASNSEDADYFWALLKDALGATPVALKLKPTKELCAEYEQAPKLELSREGLPLLWEALGGAPEGPGYREEWRAALLSHLEAPACVANALTGYNLQVAGKSAEDVVQALNSLRRMGGEQLLLREAASKVFWGLSKVLDGRSDMVAKLLEMDRCPFPESPLMISIHLPEEPVSGILFVENKTTFGILGRSGNAEMKGLAIIYSAGFLASARRLTVRSQAHCFFDAPHGVSPDDVQRVQDFLFEKAYLPSHFFGDLDFSGLAILKALKQNFPALRSWEPGYARLLYRLQEGEGHTPGAAGKIGQRDPLHTGCVFADEILLPKMRDTGLFVDQE